MTAYYNEIDPFAAAWLRELIAVGSIAKGDVDERSIVDVRPEELLAYSQCHFFAGIGVWSYALRSAGWSDDRAIWTGSCPCQPFSAAGQGAGFDDKRHLWPHFHWLIDQCRPSVVVGEQVASKDGLGWLDLVQADLEGSGYTSAGVDTCSAGVGAPHIRQRLYWMAHAVRNGAEHRPGQSVGEEAASNGSDGRLPGQRLRAGIESTSSRLDDTAGSRHAWALQDAEGNSRDETRLCVPSEGRGFSRMGNAPDAASQRDSGAVSGAEAGEYGSRLSVDGNLSIGPEHASSGMGGMANADGWYAGAEWEQRGREQRQFEEDRRVGEARLGVEPPGPVNCFWRDADWLFCRDGKWRPVEPGTSPLAHGAPARLGRLRGYGNAINAVQAQVFIEAVIEELEAA